MRCKESESEFAAFRPFEILVLRSLAAGKKRLKGQYLRMATRNGAAQSGSMPS
jgi:hypothetical protein